MLALDDKARVLVARFDPDALRPLRDIHVPQVVERTAGAAVFVAGGDGAGIGGEGVDLDTLFAILRCRFRPVARLGAIEAARKLQQIGTAPGGLEVAPHDMGIALLQLDVKLSLCRRIVDRGAVVAVNRVVEIGIDVAQQVARVFCREICE